MKYIEDEKYKKGYLMMTSAVEMLNVAMLPLYIKKGLSIDALERKMDSTFRHASMTVREPVDAEKHFEAWELELERINSGKVTVQQLDALEGIYEFFRLHVEDCTPSDYFKIYGAPYPLVLIDDPDEKLISPVLSPEVIDILKVAMRKGIKEVSDHVVIFQTVLDYLMLDDKENENDINE